MNEQLQKLLSRLDKVEKLSPQNHQARYRACCPAHGDKNPSLSIALSQRDAILLKCWSGCSPQEVVEALGMDMSDLFPPRPERIDHRVRSKRSFHAYDAVAVLARDAMFLTMIAAKLRNKEALTEKDMADLVTVTGRCQRIAEEVL